MENLGGRTASCGGMKNCLRMVSQTCCCNGVIATPLSQNGMEVVVVAVVVVVVVVVAVVEWVAMVDYK